MLKRMNAIIMLLTIVVVLSSCAPQNGQNTSDNNIRQERVSSIPYASSSSQAIDSSPEAPNSEIITNNKPTEHENTSTIELKLSYPDMVLNVSYMDFIELDGKIVMAANLSGDYTGTWIELFDTVSGESLYYAYYDELTYIRKSLQIASTLTGDVLYLAGEHQMYLNVNDPTIEHLSTPARSINDSNDYEIISWTSTMYPWDVGGWKFTSTIDGITASPSVAEDAFAFTISAEEIKKHDELPIMNLDAPVYFDDLRVVNGGSTLVANIVSESGQLGSVGVFTINFYTGEQHWFTDLFEVMGGELDYIKDYDLGVVGRESLHRISLITGEHTVTDLPLVSGWSDVSYDYESFAYSAQDENKSIVHLGNPEKPLYVSSTDRLYPEEMTENYVVMVDYIEGARKLYIAPWRDANINS